MASPTPKPKPSVVQTRHDAVIAEARKGRRWAAIGGGIAAIIALVGTFWISRLPTPNAEASDLAIAVSWPIGAGCDAGTTVAASKEVAESYDSEVSRQGIVDAGGGAFGFGHLTMTMSTASSTAIQIVNLKPDITVLDEQVAWVHGVEGGCGASSSRLFALNLDSRVIADLGESSGDGFDYRGMEGTEGAIAIDAFTVSSSSPTTAVIDALGCDANYSFTLDISYVIAGDTVVKHQRIGPFRVYGSAPDADYLFQGEAGLTTTPGPVSQKWLCTYEY